MTVTESHDLHFALGHLEETNQYELIAGRARYTLQPHTAETLSRGCDKNSALALLPENEKAQFTHFVEGAALPTKSPGLLRVVVANGSADKTTLPLLAAMAVHVPRDTRRERRGADTTPLHIPLLHSLGIDVTVASAVDVSLDADDLLTPTDTAVSLVFHHPQLLSINTQTAAVVIDKHIRSAKNAQPLARLSASIQSQKSGWSVATNSTDHNGNSLAWGPFFADRSGQTVQTYQLTSATYQAAGGPLVLPLATSQNDPTLQNATWALQQGVASVTHDPGMTAAALRVARRPRAHALGCGDPSSDFTLNNLTPGYGLEIDDSSLVFTPDENTPGAGTFSLNVTNTYLRSLWASVQFFDANGDSLGNWQSLDEGLVSPVNVILGIPMPTDPTTLTFDWPADAANATLAHGGFGVSNWINDVVWNGVILTGIFNYAIPVLFLAIGSELDSNAWLKSIEEDYPTMVAVFKAATGIIGSLATNAVGFPNVTTILTAFGDGIAGLVVHAGLEKLQAYLTEELGETVLEDSIPVVDFIFEIANRAVDLAEIGETTFEILSCPAVYEVDIKRSMPLAFTVSPDPTHGTTSNPAIWPLQADHYDATVLYKGGTPYDTTGPMLGANSSTPITVNFPSLPEGGTLQAQFRVYSADNTLLGQWTSAWVPALRPTVDTTLTLTGAIQEALVPLTAATTYSYKEKLIFSGSPPTHQWQPNEFAMAASVTATLDAGQIDSTIQAAFTANGSFLSNNATVTVVDSGQRWNITDGTVTYNLSVDGQTGNVDVFTNNASIATYPLNASDQGNNLGAAVGLTLNDRAYMLGYCWMASGQGVPAVGTTQPVISSQITTFQNINTLATPEASLKFSGVGFANQPFLVYDQFGPAPLFSLPSQYASDLDQGTVPSAVSDLFSAFSYALPTEGVTVETVTADVQWTLSVNSIPTYSLLTTAGQINVYAYPAVVISQNNFYLEPTSMTAQVYQYQMRQVVLDNTTPFDVSSQQSWGLFQLPHLNDVVVHPQGYVVGVHTNLNILEIVQIPDAAVPDAQASPSAFVGGTGTRPGLFSGPVGATATADGRLLVLEQGNARIQALDVNGNPIPCFTGRSLPSLPVTDAAGLDSGLVSVALRDTFATASAPLSAIWRVQDPTTLYQLALASGSVRVTVGGADFFTTWTLTDSSATPQSFSLALNGSSITVSQKGTEIFSVAASDAAALNAGILGDLCRAAFPANNITLMSPLQITGSGALLLDSSVIDDLSAGTVPASLISGLATRNITLGSPASVTASVAVTMIEAGVNWKLVDKTAGVTYQLLADSTSNSLAVTELSPTMPLKTPHNNVSPTYLSLAAEPKGYLYVLSYTGDGSQVADFVLDLYQPNGTWLAATTGLNAGDIVVDMWRNLYTLNLEAMQGPNGRTEPTISAWVPSV